MVQDFLMHFPATYIFIINFKNSFRFTFVYHGLNQCNDPCGQGAALKIFKHYWEGIFRMIIRTKGKKEEQFQDDDDDDSVTEAAGNQVLATSPRQNSGSIAAHGLARIRMGGQAAIIIVDCLHDCGCTDQYNFLNHLIPKKMTHMD